MIYLVHVTPPRQTRPRPLLVLQALDHVAAMRVAQSLYPDWRVQMVTDLLGLEIVNAATSQRVKVAATDDDVCEYGYSHGREYCPECAHNTLDKEGIA